ncbi:MULTISPECIES: type VI secretion system-associated FHA domain protein TagH [unclassified Bartonella]|uniref:type VI secretion system-associated FHA domain protein TagH n=1 Tax=unclassified Bartonella TaxID=2645622 RepID=UPI0021C580AB|nr:MULTISPECIES: type VI secretion system-associated FHA domain protein TagH [unclassified Bartonella]UXN05038.1 type VI secretion system-associated FHA domain protein TagH [Bartonella sp. HY406]UXN08092.1 type VI secretion system-associated FHA domain protein TagH [Bartonella sp. HY761]
MHLRLVINNTDDLSGGYSAIRDFNESGGIIGAADIADWQIVDRDGSIAPNHACIHYIDHQFCLESLVVDGLSINGAKAHLPVGEQIQITDGDTIKIGKFSVTAFVEMTLNEADRLETRGERWAKRFVSVGTLVDQQEDEDITAQNFFESKAMNNGGSIKMRETVKRAQDVDPINLIEESVDSRSTHEMDPVKLFDKVEKADKNYMASKIGDLIDVQPEDAGFAEIPDDLQPGSAYMNMPKVRGEKMSGQTSSKTQNDDDLDSYLEKLAGAAVTNAENHHNIGDVFTRDRYLADVSVENGTEELVDHVLLRPLCAALGLPIQKMSVPQANRLMGDVGEALKAAISGLMESYQRELSDKSHLAETHLHAIEDNPLRLKKSVEEVIQDLLLVRSPVHLSARAAIEESLQLIQYHQKANEKAVEEALDMVLRSLGPVALAKRFKKYKGHAPRAGDLDAWHWEMYQHYYKEMRSEQQGGLSRMFWEVYSQVYDRQMREQTLEG